METIIKKLKIFPALALLGIMAALLPGCDNQPKPAEPAVEEKAGNEPVTRKDLEELLGRRVRTKAEQEEYYKNLNEQRAEMRKQYWGYIDEAAKARDMAEEEKILEEQRKHLETLK